MQIATNIRAASILFATILCTACERWETTAVLEPLSPSQARGELRFEKINAQPNPLRLNATGLAVDTQYLLKFRRAQSCFDLPSATPFPTQPLAPQDVYYNDGAFLEQPQPLLSDKRGQIDVEFSLNGKGFSSELGGVVAVLLPIPSPATSTVNTPSLSGLCGKIILRRTREALVKFKT